VPDTVPTLPCAVADEASARTAVTSERNDRRIMSSLDTERPCDGVRRTVVSWNTRMTKRLVTAMQGVRVMVQGSATIARVARACAALGRTFSFRARRSVWLLRGVRLASARDVRSGFLRRVRLASYAAFGLLLRAAFGRGHARLCGETRSASAGCAGQTPDSAAAHARALTLEATLDASLSHRRCPPPTLVRRSPDIGPILVHVGGPRPIGWRDHP
jgi:hypothetical protein